MKKILFLFLSTFISLTIISCESSDDASTSTGNTTTSLWTKQLGTSSSDGGSGVTTDSSGNVYVAGGTYGGLDGNTSAGDNDLFVVKYNSSGTKQWTKQLGTSSTDSANGIAFGNNTFL